MLSKSDILINYFPHMKNWLILHVTLGPSCALCIAKSVERASPQNESFPKRRLLLTSSNTVRCGNYSLPLDHVRYLHGRARQGVFQNASVSNRQHSGVGYNTPTAAMHETQTAAKAELTEDIIGYTVKWAPVFIIKSVVVN